MASRAHNFIVDLVGLAMRKKGYTIVSSDSDISKISDLKFKSTPTLKRHRPDIIGLNRDTDKLCIGEAKTSSDLLSDRTKQQFEDFSSIITKSNDEVELIIGIPLSSEIKLTRLLQQLDLSDKKNIQILKVPDEMLPK
jgi:hypothetical protein